MSQESAGSVSYPKRSRAVLFGCHAYRHLDGIPAVQNNLAALHEMLLDPKWGKPGMDVTSLSPWAGADEILETVATAGEQAQDTLIVYFAGHGLIHPKNGELYLALHNSRLQRWGVAAGLPISDLRHAILDHENTADNKVLLLDCCFSGRAMAGGMGPAGPENKADLAAIEGTCVTTSSSSTSLSFAVPGDRYTGFSGALIEVLESGAPGEGPMLTMEAVYRQVDARLRARGLPRPQQRNSNLAGHIPIARNRAWIPSAGEQAPPPGPAPRTVPARRSRVQSLRIHWRRYRNRYAAALFAIVIMTIAVASSVLPAGTPDRGTPAPFPPKRQDAGLLQSASNKGKDCVRHIGDPPLGSAPIGACDAAQVDWSMWTFPNDHVRFISQRIPGVCLGADIHAPAKPVGTWGCDDPASAWVLQPQTDGSFHLVNEQALDNGLKKRCAARHDTAIYLDECRDDTNHAWLVPQSH
ncbi:caspase, EACC1-associated type [Streptomyces sp. CB03234]|uniref:caspase, EACC1-associated type n=1 Tax=Streptomyces sp. (strain CB03234) TaxID=1703937 RepID=UPI003082ABE3